MISLHTKLQEERERKKEKQSKEPPPKDEDMLFYVRRNFQIEIKLYFYLFCGNILQETTIEGKKIPLAQFNPSFMSSPPQLTAGQKYRLSFKTVNADAKLIR